MITVALIGAFATVLAAWVSREGRRTRDHSASQADVHRLEGKVDAMGDTLSDVVAWKTLHDVTPHPQLAAVASTRRRRRT